MGSACCVASRERTHSNRTGSEILRRNALYSPSWSFRWDNNRGRVAGEIETPSYQVSQGISRNASMELKGPLGSERGNFSDMGSPLENFGSPISQKSTVHGRIVTHPMMNSPSDISVASNYSPKVKFAESPGITESPTPNLPFSMPQPSLTQSSDPLASTSYPIFLPNSTTPSRRARRSPGHQLLRQVSDSRILGLKSPNSVSEGRPSFVLSNCSNDLAAGSHGGSSDGWSMRTFSELVASQRERWSFDSERFFGSVNSKIGESSSRFSYSPSMDIQFCGACSKLLAERSSWVVSSELSVVSVLVCGHIYHAECLETMTGEVDKYDPPCPICVVGEKQLSRISRRAWRAETELRSSKSRKISKNRVVDSYLDGGDLDAKCSRMEPSSSTKSSSLAKPFLKRHFSIGSKWSRSLSENDSAKKKGFWGRYRKD